MIEQLDPQRINDRVQELLYSLGELDDDSATAVLACALGCLLDSVNEVAVTERVVSYFNSFFPEHFAKVLSKGRVN